MILVSIVLVLILWPNAVVTLEKQDKFFQRPGVNASEILRAHNYHTKDYEFISDDGHIIGLTRASVWPFKGNRSRPFTRCERKPILFVHGFASDSTSFIANSFNVQASDKSSIDLSQLRLAEAIDLLAEDPASKSLPMQAMNLGHEVWLLHRRGTPASRRRVEPKTKPLSPHQKMLLAREYGKTKRPARSRRAVKGSKSTSKPSRINRIGKPKVDKVLAEKERLVEALKHAPPALLDYFHYIDDIKLTLDQGVWNYSMDQQAAYDVPGAIDVVRLVTRCKKVLLLGESAGGGIVLMSLIMNPDLERKVSKTFAWVPALFMNHSKLVSKMGWLVPTLQSYVGPFPWPFLTFPLQAVMEVFCSLELIQKHICQKISDLTRGKSRGQAPLNHQFYSNQFVPVSSGEATHIMQLASSKRPHLYDYGSVEKNMAAYGRPSPLEYDPSLITVNVSFLSSPTDQLVKLEDVEQVIKSMKAPSTLRVIDRPGVVFNHGSTQYHKDVAKLVVIPTLKEMVTS